MTNVVGHPCDSTDWLQPQFQSDDGLLTMTSIFVHIECGMTNTENVSSVC